jgi:hypothetical protein
MTCPEGTCSELSATYYEQVSEQFAYTVVGGAPYVKAPVLSFMALGAPTTFTLSGNPTAQWLDFGSSWQLVNPLVGSTGAERWFATSGTSGTANPGGEQTTTYQRQYSVIVSVSGANCGTTTPSGANWEDSVENFQIASSAASGCTFSAWEVTGLVTVAQPGQVSTTAFADSNGSITASFARKILPAFPASTVILILGVCVIAAAAIGIVAMKSRSPRSAIPHE